MPMVNGRQTPGYPVVISISERLRLSSGHHAYGSAAWPLRPQINDGVVLEYIHVQHFKSFQHFQFRNESLNLWRTCS